MVNLANDIFIKGSAFEARLKTVTFVNTGFFLRIDINYIIQFGVESKIFNVYMLIRESFRITNW